MAPYRNSKYLVLVFFFALLICLGPVSNGLAAPQSQDDDPPQPEHTTDRDCKDCHLDVAESWSHSPHAHAFDDPVFQERWTGMGDPGECLLCHTTNYQSTSGDYSAPGVDCEACHGKTGGDHPPAAVPILADTEYCGTCHTTTLGEWRLTGHAGAEVGCSDCHDPHSQDALFEVADEMCLNCHREDMGEYLEDLHVQKNIGCVDCHALVIPPEVTPVDGIVPTGHSFTITPGTCVACHTDALHAGFHLPGYEHGAKAANGGEESDETVQLISQQIAGPSFEEQIQALEGQLETTQAALASRTMTTVFQGGIIGLVLGGSTAWIVAINVRRRRMEIENVEENNEQE
jgi:hypothetical protein